jgi:hypothetical protein
MLSRDQQWPQAGRGEEEQWPAESLELREESWEVFAREERERRDVT